MMGSVNSDDLLGGGLGRIALAICILAAVALAAPFGLATVGFGALLFRTVQLFFIRDVRTGLVWMTKILTDPFHDFMLYYRAPLYLLGGQLIDPMDDVREPETFLTVRDA